MTLPPLNLLRYQKLNGISEWLRDDPRATDKLGEVLSYQNAEVMQHLHAAIRAYGSKVSLITA